MPSWTPSASCACGDDRIARFARRGTGVSGAEPVCPARNRSVRRGTGVSGAEPVCPAWNRSVRRGTGLSGAEPVPRRRGGSATLGAVEPHVCPECGQTSDAPGPCPDDGAALLPSGDDPLLGQAIGSYRVARLIGSGGMGRVYRAVQPAIGGRVAVKVLSHECARHKPLVDRFFAEARAVNIIRHEHIVNVLDLAMLPDGRPYIVMEHLDGAPLSAIIKQRGALPLGSLCRVIGEVLSALASAHAKGIIHRDLKPDNVFVTPAGHARVLDFGIAKLAPELAGAPGPTRTGSLLGTPHYMSPEQAHARPADARADLYSTGVMLFEGATGRLPFEASSLFELLQKHIETPPPSPKSLRPDIPAALNAAILRPLEKDPARRFQSAAAMAQALAEATAALPRAAWDSLGGAAHGFTIGPGTPGANDIALSTTGSSTRGEVASARAASVSHARSYGTRFALAAAALFVTSAAIVAGLITNRARPAETVAVRSDALEAALPTAPAPRTAAPASWPPADGGATRYTAPANWPPVAAPIAVAPAPVPAAPPALSKPAPTKPAPPVDASTPPRFAETQAAATTTKPMSAVPSPQPVNTAAAPSGLIPTTPSANVAAHTDLSLLVTNAQGLRTSSIRADHHPDWAHLDVMRFVMRLREYARAHAPDAELAYMDPKHVGRDGFADMKEGGGTSTVVFRSRLRAVVDEARRGLPVPCNLYAFFSATGAQLTEIPDSTERCRMPTIGPLRCSAAKVWQKAITDGAAATGYANLDVHMGSKGPTWQFKAEDFEKSYPDDCD